MTKSRATLADEAAERDKSIEVINALIEKGNPDAVYTTVMHVSRTGMSRVIKVVLADVGEDGRAYAHDVSWRVARILGWRYSERQGGVVVNGGGMDMGFHLVYSLSGALGRGSAQGNELRQRWL